MLFNEQMDLFEGNHAISALADSLVDGVSYKRFQVKTIDPATKKDIRVIAYALAGKSNLPISLSGTVENKYHCSIAFLDVYFSGFDGFVRKSYKYVPYQLSDVERKVLQCFKN